MLAVITEEVQGIENCGAIGAKRVRLEADAIPAEAAMVMSALEAGHRNTTEKRAARRCQYRVAAALRLFSDQESTAPKTLYTREVNRRSLGFITAHRLPLGYGGVIALATPRGSAIEIHCTLLRCREAAPGWYEGSVYFNREQPIFDLLEKP